jgi:hypothetical protein
MFRPNYTGIQLVLAGQAPDLKLIAVYLVFYFKYLYHARITRPASFQL